MTLQEAYFVTEIVVGIAIIVSIAFVALELRQNSYLLRKSMADQRSERINWVLETVCTDADFRDIERRINTEYTTFDEDERFRANYLGVRVLRCKPFKYHPNSLDSLILFHFENLCQAYLSNTITH